MGKMNSFIHDKRESKDPFYASVDLGIGKRSKTLNRKTVKFTQDNTKDLLTDDHQNKWFYNRVDKKGYIDLVAVNPNNDTVVKKKLYGTPNIYEFPDHVVIACEGDGETGSVYQYSKATLELVEEWEIDGFIWDVNMYNNSVCVSAYVVDLDMARLYILSGRSIDFVELGTHFAPADILVLQNDLFISAYPLTERSPKKILRLNDEFDLVKEYDVSICPRFLFKDGEEILIQELDVKTGRSDRYSSLDLQTGREIITKRRKPRRCVSFY
ncbi:hypothetical protein [Alkalihalobacillus sp. TS-13]|uniref:hypothetical protein n=1 Tax=Alkalihalobacillus sp. TS-13 TaxID=2842455 RepID=UPI001C86DC8F|nr:hypothetical protein [Alkalihalobacillus sp. TS-13]